MENVVGTVRRRVCVAARQQVYTKFRPPVLTGVPGDGLVLIAHVPQNVKVTSGVYNAAMFVDIADKMNLVVRRMATVLDLVNRAGSHRCV